jgi:hypothetical protein
MPDDGSMVSGDEEVNKEEENESWEDEFNHAKLLWMKDHNLGVHFSYSTRLLLLHEHCATAKCADLKVQLDLNDTRVDAQHGLFLSLIRMMPALRMYLLQYTGDNAESIDMSR